MGGIAAARPVRVSIAMAIFVLLVADMLAFRSVANRARPVALQDVIARYRAHVMTQPAGQPATSGFVAAAPGSTTTPTAAGAAAVLPSPTLPQTRTTSTTKATVLAGPAALTDPAPGVYVYDTSGHEETNVAGGAHHSYPARTTITVTSTPCGFNMRWDGLEQRWDQWKTCVVGRKLVVQTESMKHAFYGVSDQRTYTCSGAMFRPGPEVAGTPITGQCAGAGDNGAWSGQVAGLETLDIGGQAVRAIHVVMEEHVTGDTSGSRKSENWFDQRSGLLLKRVASVVGDSSTPVGRAHYTEAVTLLLTSLNPSQ